MYITSGIRLAFGGGDALQQVDDLYDFIGQFDAQWNLLMAASVLFVLPPLAIFFLSQRVFVLRMHPGNSLPMGR